MTIEQSKIDTDNAIAQFKLVEQKRLSLEVSEHKLWILLRRSVDIGRYAQATDTYMNEIERDRSRARNKGKLPDV
jgi:hypothetical protein